jgi:RND family efflux transporter MFP subunit
MKKSTINYVSALVSILVLAAIVQACTDSNGKANSIPRKSEPIPVKITLIEKSVSAPTILVSGQLTTDDETILSFKVNGVVKDVFVKEGDKVNKGQLLATLDLTEINAQVAQARLGFEKAQRDFQRVTNLHKDSVATLEQLQNSQTALSVAKEFLDAANFNRSFAEIHAPASGFVLRKFANAGQVVSTGNPVLQTNGIAQSSWILKTGVSDKQWARIKLNDKANVKLDAFPDRTFQATVIRKAGTSDLQTGAFTVELKVNSEDVRLATGMFGSAELQSGDAKNSWSVPYEAVLDANGNEGFIFVTTDNQIVKRKAVVIESFDGEVIHISEGLEGNEALIVAGSAYLSDGSPIVVIK